MNNFSVLKHIIETRRSSRPALMNGKKIDDSIISQLLRLGDWAPTHAHTEPWRFVVFANDAVQQFGKDHADLYKAGALPEKFETARYEKLLHTGDHASHIIAVYMKRGANPKITVTEEICAVAAGAQNILLGAAALGIAALWSTGGLTLQPAMKTYFGLNTEDQMIGLLYLGYTDTAAKEGKRIMGIEEKVEWRALTSN